MTTTFGFDTKYGYSIKIFAKDVIKRENENLTERVYCFQTITDYPSMLTLNELKNLLIHLSSIVGYDEMIQSLQEAIKNEKK